MVASYPLVRCHVSIRRCNNEICHRYQYLNVLPLDRWLLVIPLPQMDQRCRLKPMKVVLNMLAQGFESSTTETLEFNQFFREFKREFNYELRSINGKKARYMKGHFGLSGFFTFEDKVYYFSLSDVRHFPDSQLLIRTALNYSDFTGGSNQYATIEKGMLKKFFNL